MSDLLEAPKKSCAFSEAWKNLGGLKGPVWGSVIVMMLIFFGCELVAGLFAYLPTWMGLGADAAAVHAAAPAVNTMVQAQHTSPEAIMDFGVGMVIFAIVLGILDAFILLPMRMGFLLTPIRHANGKKTGFYIFKYFHHYWCHVWRFIGLAVLMGLFIGIPYFLSHAFLSHFLTMFAMSGGMILLFKVVGVLLGLLTLYLAIACYFSSYLLVDKKLSPWRSLITSIKGTTKKWFTVLWAFIWSVLVLYLIPGIVTALCLVFLTKEVAFTIAIAVFILNAIWALPYMMNLLAILYRNIFGISGQDPVTLIENGMTEQK
ncbi:MAG: hypothetical protein A3I77_07880 [Gammaproteobacteria bacterium RIFCSPLOWO2_02_FULL_42_14]|nr:MAG: hypothetical protein A3B71_03715 [Gammaproteobacteria bacterium RIFCSPHIGHO2_02_FULL_42_43]OGT27292.1 MAG: hypothetical protein A2624_03080 [Gammaproteobacteria bacterium RIFCSPHIGHO2_01_FULL_42_8]OGT52966.1 MAG: hypothetical protein A3E54_07810 [Gammaproteobacteria bacterium RIFCSPHIGHO2_12_FULL_41_25]OGT61260.1 MAG: hypothetical protein A3I77_07880 [Gammaproteobacteria bacterium RIFCSPLOWO2_02_FULL_42_14]OGT87189.1 MAG: hypothetical protein A3G86_01605 [Gammaproteobacteria bacterium R